jgi:hypothetical protein
MKKPRKHAATTKQRMDQSDKGTLVSSQSAGMPRTPNASRCRSRVPASRSVWSAAYPAALASDSVTLHVL